MSNNAANGIAQNWRRIGLACLLLFGSGCTSFRSMIVDRTEDGRVAASQPLRRSPGIPVTLNVPTHVDVAIQETYFIDSDPNAQTHSIEPSAKILNVECELKYTEQVFTVDVVRPAAGTLRIGENGILIDENQYFKTIGGQSEDEMIATISKVLQGDLGSQISKGRQTRVSASAVDPQVGKTGLIPQKRTVAFRRFDISQPDWERELEIYIDTYLCDPGCRPADLSRARPPRSQAVEFQNPPEF